MYSSNLTKKDDSREAHNAPIIELNLKTKSTFIVTEHFHNQVKYLHSKITRDEWSGPLYYKLFDNDKNEIKTVDGFLNNDCVIVPTYILPMNKGKGMTTEYEIDDEVLFELWDHIEDIEEHRMGHIHTHVDSSTFFSGVDTEQLQEGAFDFDMFLSVIVNMSDTYTGKISIKALRNQSYDTETPGNKVSFKGNTQEVVLTKDIEFKFESAPVVDSFFTSQVDNIIKEANNSVSYHKQTFGFNYTPRNNNDVKSKKKKGEPDIDDAYKSIIKDHFVDVCEEVMGYNYTSWTVRNIVQSISHSPNSQKHMRHIGYKFESTLPMVMYNIPLTDYSDITEWISWWFDKLSKETNSITVKDFVKALKTLIVNKL